jgi:hypothetical protein
MPRIEMRLAHSLSDEIVEKDERGAPRELCLSEISTLNYSCCFRSPVLRATREKLAHLRADRVTRVHVVTPVTGGLVVEPTGLGVPKEQRLPVGFLGGADRPVLVHAVDVGKRRGSLAAEVLREEPVGFLDRKTLLDLACGSRTWRGGVGCRRRCGLFGDLGRRHAGISRSGDLDRAGIGRIGRTGTPSCAGRTQHGNSHCGDDEFPVHGKSLSNLSRS